MNLGRVVNLTIIKIKGAAARFGIYRISPTKATPPAVDSTAVRNGARCSMDHVCCIVLTSNAASLPMLPFTPGISRKRRSPAAAARAFLELDFPPGHLHAALAQRNDQLIRPRMVAHRLPVVPAFRARTRREPLPDALLQDVAAVSRLPGLRIDARKNVLKDGLLEPEKLARLPSSFHKVPVLPIGSSS